jgi:hypothetical protein
MPFKDYLNRHIILKKSVFKKHTTVKYINKYEIRHLLFPRIKDVLNKPYEIYLKSYHQKSPMQYIKMYNDMMLLIEI